MKKNYFAILTVFFAFFVNSQAQEIRYVKVNGTGDGTSWTAASCDIQAMSDQLVTLGGGEVWVAQGNYYPTHPANNGFTARHNTFLLKTNVKVYGGFPSIGTPLFVDRNCRAYQTILSGDLVKNDVLSGTTISTLSIGNTSDNVYHVVLSVGNTGKSLLDGFTIQGGCGVWANSSTYPVVNSLAINTQTGGGALLVNSTSTISNCVFTLNQGKGMGLASGFTVASSNVPNIINCQFIKNYSSSDGAGAVYLTGGNKGITQLTNCLIAENSSKSTSANTTSTIYLDGDCKIINTTIVNNYPGVSHLSFNYLFNNSIIFGGFTSGTNLVYLNDARQNTSLIEGSSVADLAIGGITANQVFTLISPNLGASNYTLKSGSPAFNVGTNSFNTTTIDLAGNSRINGTIDLGAYESTMVYVTTTNPSIASLDLTAAKDLTVSSAGELTIDAFCNVHNIIIESGGKVTLNDLVELNVNNISINSNAVGTGTFVDKSTTGLAVTGTVQQYLGSARNWYITPPVANATVPSGQTYYSYLEAGSNTGFIAPASLYWVAETQGAALDPRKGYIVQSAGETTLNFNGTLNTGNKSLQLTRTTGKLSAGFNLVANPYPSYLDWTMVSAANSGLLTTAWFRTKNNSGNYIFATVNVADPQNPTIVAVNPNTTISTLIPPMQAYWVRVSASGTTNYVVNNSMRKHIDDIGNKFKAPKQITQQLVRLQISNGTNADEAVILFNSNADNSFDMFDSPKMIINSASLPEIYTQIGSEKLVINGMKNITYNSQIPLGFSTLQANDFSISAKEISNLEAGTKVILIDKLNHSVETELTNATPYNFSAPITVATTKRFSLIFRAPGNTTGIANPEKLIAQVFVNAANQITIVAPEKSAFSIYDAVGRKVCESLTTTTNRTTVNSINGSGIFVVLVSENGRNYSTRVIINGK